MPNPSSETQSSAASGSRPTWNPHAAVLGWVFPGLGHIILGQYRRGIILSITIMSLWLAGILIGGISVMDRMDRGARDEKSWWFYAQGMIAPSLVVERVRAKMLANYGRSAIQPDPDAPYTPSLAKVAEQGVLYTALAGLLNLLAMIDALYCDTEQRRLKFREGSAVSPGGTAAAARKEATT